MVQNGQTEEEAHIFAICFITITNKVRWSFWIHASLFYDYETAHCDKIVTCIPVRS